MNNNLNNHYKFDLSPDNNKMSVVEANGIDIILNVLKEHINNDRVCTNGCILLNEMLEGDSNCLNRTITN